MGLIEEVKILSKDREETILAKIDTGADKSSIDMALASKLGLNLIKTIRIKSAEGKSVRPVVNAKLILAGREVEDLFTLSNRKKLRHQVLIGQNILKKGFIIDPNKE